MIVLSLLLLLLTCLSRSAPLLQIVILFLGIFAGIGNDISLYLMLDLTLPQAAGTFVGVWGLAQATSRVLGKLIGGGLFDFGRWLVPGPNPYLAFASVFLVEALLSLASLLLLLRVNVLAFREDTDSSFANVLTMEIG